MTKKILIVDDEADIVELLGYNLAKEGYQIFTAHNGMQAVEMAKKNLPDLILMDVMMPVMDGVEACRQIRALRLSPSALVVFLSARDEEFTQLAAYQAGGDDFINKPIKPRILISKIEALLKLTTRENADILEVADIKINRENYLVYYNSETFTLPKKEFELLCVLSENPSKVFGRHEILDKVWGSEVVVGDRTIDVHIRKLRERFGNERFTTIKGVGYKINQD
ncbi:MAG: DNA-binding response regulator [Flavobacteriaceae bacterium]|nr:MAG: DNA-binding response regulator [Flavobacteriaceae bacterium]